MTRRQIRRAQDDCLLAASFLREDLVWSSDFDRIRIQLADLLRAEGHANAPDPVAVKMARTIMQDEWDLTI